MQQKKRQQNISTSIFGKHAAFGAVSRGNLRESSGTPSSSIAIEKEKARANHMDDSYLLMKPL
jgi:hypothetical protein